MGRLHFGSALLTAPDVVLEKPHHRRSQGTSSFPEELSTDISRWVRDQISRQSRASRRRAGGGWLQSRITLTLLSLSDTLGEWQSGPLPTDRPRTRFRGGPDIGSARPHPRRTASSPNAWAFPGAAGRHRAPSIRCGGHPCVLTVMSGFQSYRRRHPLNVRRHRLAAGVRKTSRPGPGRRAGSGATGRCIWAGESGSSSPDWP